jgi:hypothetical protein
MGYTFGPFDITGSVVNTSGSIILTGSMITTQAILSPSIYTTLVFDDMEFYHVSGTRSYFAGVGIPITASAFGAGMEVINGSYHLTLEPTASAPYKKWQAFSYDVRNLKLLSYRMYTNMTGSDFPAYTGGPNGPNISYVSFGQAYATAPNSATSGQIISNTMYSSVSGAYDQYDGNWDIFYSAGPVSTGGTEIGDAGTLYISSPVPFPISMAPTAYSPTYFTFLMSIGAGFATKTYKFRFALDVQDLGF